jgi:hypothetical protein
MLCAIVEMQRAVSGAHYSLFQSFVEGASAMRTRLYELPSPSPADPESGEPGLDLR